MSGRRFFWGFKISTYIVVTACFFLLQFTYLVNSNLKSLLDSWGEDIQLSIYLKKDVTPEQFEAIKSSFDKFPNVIDVEFIDQVKAQELFAEKLSAYSNGISQDPEIMKQLPQSFRLTLSEKLDPMQKLKEIKKISDELKEQAGIEEFSYGEEWVERYRLIVGTVEKILWVIFVFVAIASIFVLGNAIRDSIEAHKEDIVIYEMVGASPWMIRKPFVMEGLAVGGFGAVLATSTGYLLFRFFKRLVDSGTQNLELTFQLQYLSIPAVIAFFGLFLILGIITSFLFVAHINTGYAAQTEEA